MRNVRRSLLLTLSAVTLAATACGTSSAGSVTTVAVGTVPVAANVGTAAGTVTAGSSTGATGTTTAAGAARQAAFAAYSTCMATNGVTLPAIGNRGGGGSTTSNTNTTTPGSTRGTGYRPGGSTPPPGVDPALYAKAMAACASQLPTGGFGGGGGGAGGRLNNAAYVACMQDAGIALPTPTSSTAPGSTTTSADPTATTAAPIDRTSAAYQVANTKCSVLLPNGGAGSGGASTTTSVG